MLFDYPNSTKLDRRIAKAKIFEHANPSKSLHMRFAQEVREVRWTNKLSPESLNIKPAKTFQEIQVFSIHLYQGISTLSTSILQAIDKTIPFPILFEVRRDIAGSEQSREYCVVASFKRVNEANKEKWVQSGYNWSLWVKENSPRVPFPLAYDLDILYEQLLSPLFPVQAIEGEKLEDRDERAKKYVKLSRNLNSMTAKLDKELQFNRKIEWHNKIKKAESDLVLLLPNNKAPKI